MKRINLKDYNSSLGTLIDLEIENKFRYINGSINIPYQKLIYNYQNLLDKNKPYYIICSGGVKSKKIVSILELYGYNVTQVYKE
ncbi:MAG: rhodanese-like domain-containing protein [Firmicutes bacterium]|nr:rhodanese-like domain-containing protein [Bacillota bacterium]